MPFPLMPAQHPTSFSHYGQPGVPNRARSSQRVSLLEFLVFEHDVKVDDSFMKHIHMIHMMQAALAWNQDGSLLATASDKGTVIRVHRLPEVGLPCLHAVTVCTSAGCT